MLPPGAGEETPSLPLLASDDMRRSLTCGYITSVSAFVFLTGPSGLSVSSLLLL